MKTNSFWSLVPKGVKVAAGIVFACVFISGPIISAYEGYVGGLSNPDGISPIVFVLAVGSGSLLVGALLALWLVCVGYVYADARRRSMPAVLWVLIAIFVPNLLGFLLYFAIRRPLGSPCSSCGQPIAAQQRFCSWCGSQSFAAPAVASGLHSPGSGAAPTSAI
jgi:hypothetical protein